MQVNVIGGGWVTAVNYGRMTEVTGRSRPVLRAGDPVIPPASVIYAQQPVRYRRFDAYSRTGCAAIALALKDAGLDRDDRRQPVGIVAATRYGCFDTDQAFHDTAKQGGGLFASPNLFSFTLPGIALGEAAIHFQLTGPVFTVGDSAESRGCTALGVAVDLLACGPCHTVIAGWLDVWKHPFEENQTRRDTLQGGIFVVLSTGYLSKSVRKIRQEGSRMVAASGAAVRTIADLFD